MNLHTFYAALAGDLTGALERLGTPLRLTHYLRKLPEDAAGREILRARLTQEELRRAAHSLRGAAGMLGLTQLAQRAAEAEEGTVGDGAMASTRLRRLEGCLQRTIGYVEAMDRTEACLKENEADNIARCLMGAPEDICVIHAETGRMIWGKGQGPERISETIWDAAWLGRTGQEAGFTVWPYAPGYAICRRENSSGPDALSMISHDLRTPLHVICSMAAQAQRSPGDGRHVADCLECISVAGQHLEAIIRDVLEGSEAAAGPEETFSLPDMLRRVALLMQQDAASQGLQLTLALGMAQEWVHADRCRLARVIMNLTSNAIKYTLPGGVIELSCREISPSLYEIAVEDTGAGMSASFIRRAFEPYTRCADGQSGQGLGLHIVHRLVTGLGGEVFVRSQPGLGTAVKIRLALVRAVPPRPISLQGMRVLLADDDPLSVRASAMMLEELGARVTIVQSGTEAIRRALGHDCILMDLNLPDMNGGEATRRIRYAGGRVPVAAFTADASMRARQWAEQCGMQCLIPKPVQPELLAQTLLALTGRNI